LCVALPFPCRASDDASSPIGFNRDVRPLLAEKCFTCHGPDKNKREADLRLDVRDSAVADRGGYQVIVPGNPDDSLLLDRVTSDDEDERMPPAGVGKSLSPRDVEILRAWIAQGAEYQPHWSFVPPQRPPLPTASRPDWVRNPIDLFILARLEQEGLAPSPDADRRTLIRRLAFDLTGLPPTPDAVDAFVADGSPSAYEQLVDQFLASEHFGERMATYWLDVVRYADSGGYHSDNERSVWLYRDYVIRAFHQNYAFDRFTMEQIAGDLLPDATIEQKVASGYNRLLQTTEEGGAQPQEYTLKYQSDRVRNTAAAWLGITMGCCECHDHKYDPFTMKDFYSLGAFFADVQEKAVGRQDQMGWPSPEQEAQLAPLNQELAQLREALSSATEEAKPALQDKIKQKESEVERVNQTVPQTLVSVSVAPRVVRILPRGNWQDQSGEIVGPATPAVFPPATIADRQRARLDFAQWLVAPDNPLVARVFVNRLWKLFYGQGIVRTVSDFGTQGEWPTHPELLDWLAVELRDGKWDVKRLVKTLVMSHTYQQASHVTADLRQRDPNNKWLARQTSFRLGAEFIRDGALTIAGLLSPKVGGPSVKPYQPAGYWQYLNFPKREWQNDHGESLYRRGVYTHWQRTFLQPSLLAFDAPSREECTADRARSNTPLQSLALLNDPTYVEAARVFAARIVEHGGASPQDRLKYAFRQALQRLPNATEENVLMQLLENHQKQYAQAPDAAAKIVAVGEQPRPESVDNTELAAWTSAARVLLNLHETITRY
jgi:hypothetical protein